MTMSIHPETIETSECVICYESHVELISICHNNHNLCKNCFVRIKNNTCPFCRQQTIHEQNISTDVDVELGDVVTLEQTTRNIENAVQHQTQTCSFIVPCTYLCAIAFLSYLFVTNVKHFGPAEQVIFFILILMLTTCMLLFCKKTC
jgi:hypothetical protein